MNYKLIKLINKLIKDEKLININVLGKTRNRKILNYCSCNLPCWGPTKFVSFCEVTANLAFREDLKVEKYHISCIFQNIALLA